MRRQLMISALFAFSAAFVGCQSSESQMSDNACTMPACTMPDCAIPDCDKSACDTPRTQPAQTQRLSAVTLPPETVGSILDRSTWNKMDTHAPVPVIQHFPVLIRDVESPDQKRARAEEDPNETSEQRLDRALDHANAGNWNRTNAKDAALQPLKFMYDVGTIWINTPVDLYHGVPQTPDPEAEKIRREKCILYP